MNTMTDFNDLHRVAGPDAVKECIDSAINSGASCALESAATGQLAVWPDPKEIKTDLEHQRVTKENPCPKCKVANKVRTPYCIKCAEPLTDPTAPCAMCGKFNRMGTRCCIHCGNRLR